MKAFLRYYVELPYPVRKVDEVINGLSEEWLDRAAREANLRGLLMLDATIGQEASAAAAGPLVVLLSPAQLGDGLIRRPVQWFTQPQPPSGPVLRGDLELAELGAARTQLALSAQYQPFLHSAGADERMAAQRIGESTLKAFVDRIACYVEVTLEGTTPKLTRTSPTPPAAGADKPRLRHRWAS